VSAEVAADRRENNMSKIVHFEIPVDDPQQATTFYHDALGWEIARLGDEPYWLVRAGVHP